MSGAGRGTEQGTTGGELSPGARLGRYVILKHLGHGGMGVVYLAFDGELERRVAIKVLRAEATAGLSAGETRARLLREAQAMAKVSHPNVVSVYDVGTFGNDVFIAMEYVRGTTLREWRYQTKPRPRALVEMYIQAGRGLEAAHAAGILHRDFKSDNVLVDEQGHAKVLDFGLARLEERTEEASEKTDKIALSETGVDHKAGLSTPITRVGSILGTPAYMAPEQILGETATARSDQFAFCVALYEAICGVLPFEGESLTTLASNIYSARIRPVPSGVRCPRGVRRVIVRGLDGTANKRFVSMSELLEALERALGAPVRWLARGGAVAMAAGMTALVALRPGPPKVCRGAEQELAPAWSAARAEEVRRAFKATGSELADEAFAHTKPILDKYAASWIAASTDACEATRVRGTQSSEALDLRMGCLGQRSKELKATVNLLAHADDKTLDRSVEAAARLTPVDSCSDVSVLRAPFAPPKDEAQRRAVDDARKRLADVQALLNAAKFDEALPLATALAADPAVAGYTPLRADASLAVADAAASMGKPQVAFDAYLDAAIDGERSKHDVAAAHGWTGLVWANGALRTFAEAERDARIADAVIARVPDNDLLRADLFVARSRVEQRQNQDKEARQDAQQALAIRERVLGPNAPPTLEAKSHLADSLWYEGAVEESIPLYEALYRDRVALLGEANVASLRSLGDLADIKNELGDYGAAQTLARKELSLARVEWQIASARIYLGQALACSGSVSEGETSFDQGIAQLDGVLGKKGSHESGTFCADFARRLAQRGLYHEAEPEAERALAIFAREGKPGPEKESAIGVVALCKAHRGDSAGAIANATQVLESSEKQLGRRGDMVPLLARGEALLSVHRNAEALADLEHAREIADTTRGEPAIRADVRFATARAVLAETKDAARAVALAKRAASELEAAGLPAEGAKVRAWIAATDAGAADSATR